MRQTPVADVTEAAVAPTRAVAEPNIDEVSAAELVAAELAGSRRRWPFLLAGLLVGAAATYGALTYLDRSEEDDLQESETVELSTAPVEARDLSEEVEWAGLLQYGEPLNVAGNGGVVTSATSAGTEMARGDIIATVDGEPVVLLYGQRPLWRSLAEGTEGVDVFLLESNLVALGYDPDVTVSVDQEFTANTALMVERWQEDLGREATGRVELTDVALIPGPGVVTTEAALGEAAGATLATVSSQRTVTDVVSKVEGVISDPLPVGTEVVHGVTLFFVDTVPVVAVGATETGDDPVLTELMSDTFTDLELEEALAAAGHDPDETMTVDGIITDATVETIERWQSAAGLPVTGLAAPAYYQPMPDGQAVDTIVVTEEVLAAGTSSAMRPILTTSTSELQVEVEVAVADADEFVEGQSVTITLADEAIVDGVVSDIGQVRRQDNQSDPTVTIGIEVIADADQELVEGTVSVTTVSELIEGATTVPTRALVSLAEGGFAVEVADANGSTRLVAVELGTFDDGHVQITSGDVSVGDELVVPQ
jgi:peptidoglycan hydrolase-like protein with peptidoglycan-binding domain